MPEGLRKSERTPDESPRVLHVTSALDPGGIETWLLRLAQCGGSPQRVTAILVLGHQEGLLAPRFRELGVEIYLMDPGRSLLRFLGRLQTVLRQTGPWDVVHSHVYRRSALVLLAARWRGVPLRIAHSHTVGTHSHTVGTHSQTTGNHNQSAGNSRNGKGLRLGKVADWLAALILRTVSNERIACSAQAARALFGDAAGDGLSYTHMPCGVDLALFRRAASAFVSRASLAIPPGAIVVGHVGRFVPEKNHRYLLEVAAVAAGLRSGLHFLLVGDGPLRAEMESLAGTLNIRRQVTFAGNRMDVPALLSQTMDVFFFPSMREGFGVALLEAQAAGLPCMFSDRIAPEANVNPERNRHFTLDTPPSETAKALVAFLACARTPSACAPRATLPADCQITHNAAQLSAIYAKARRRDLLLPEVQRDEQPA